jgi:hypothetical protein
MYCHIIAGMFSPVNGWAKPVFYQAAENGAADRRSVSASTPAATNTSMV